MKRLKEILNLLDFKQILDIIFFPIIAIISLLTKPFCKDIWLIQENSNEACDNGYIFFKYLRENRKDVNVYYVINFKSKDYKKVESLGNIIKYRSLKHWMYYLNANKIIVTQKYANPSPALFYILHIKNIIKTPRIFLQHGITKDDAQMYYFDKTKFRLFICGAKKEYEYVKTKFGYPSENVVYTGFARFDKLQVFEKNKLLEKHNNLILIAPTWRKWIHNQKDFDVFMQNYLELINNKNFINILEHNNIHVQMVLHKNMKKFKIKQQPSSNNIQINHNEDINIQSLLNEADLLITDYSSIFFDMAYRKVPIIYYQFDREEYRKMQLPQGYFSYEEDGFGDFLQNVKAVINKTNYYIENNFNIESIYSNRMDEFFERKDTNNCKRILQEIEKL